MGVYPTYSKHDSIKHKNGCETWEEQRSVPGVVYARQVIATRWEEKERTDCFCCSCPDDGGQDPYCRNHGFAGRRPCDAHLMPGSRDDEDQMPTSVQVENARQRALDEIVQFETQPPNQELAALNHAHVNGECIKRRMGPRCGS